jgi:hypothetical protein
MIEQGLSQLVQGTTAVSAIAPVGGFYGQLPKGQALPSWSFIFVSDNPIYTLDGPNPLTNRRLQLDCYGNTGAEAITLGTVVDNALSGYTGTLADPDATVVQGCFRSNLIDFFDYESRTFRRMLEYSIWFVAS